MPADYCGNPDSISPKDSCSDFLLKDQFRADFSSKCGGKESCYFTLVNYVDTSISPDPKVQARKQQCNSEFAKIYVQYQCLVEDSYSQGQKVKAMVVIFICTLCTILYLLTIYWLRSTSNLEFKVWDIDTITVADYSIMVKITPAMWSHY